MNGAFYKHEFNIMLKSRKNLLFLLLLGIGLVIYCFMILPNYQSYNYYDRERAELMVQEKEAMQEGRERRGATGIILFTGMPVYAMDQYEININKAMMAALDDENYYRFFHLHILNFGWNQGSFLLDDPHFDDSPFPQKDRNHIYYKTMIKNESLISSDFKITPALISEQTTVQALTNLFLGYLPFVLLFIVIFFSSDVVVRDRLNKTIIQGIPLSWYRVINIKSLVVFFYSLLIIVALALLAVMFISIQFGFGYLSLQIGTMPLQQTFTLLDYETMSIGSYLLLTLSFLPICAYLFIRLSVLFNLIFKNQWVVLITSSLVLFLETFYFTRTTRELFGIDVSFFPQTYFDFGKVVTGEKNFLINVESITYTKGIVVLLISILVVEVTLFIMAKWINKRRFYK
ncbi:hypothetical protein [Alkalihalobacillus pseudalcaliphilus]|uniref:hypothetical protein n=1 Tax=Alkalihalobacillus pseudalcaliphilus TaxID=79884 RepID=UPI00064DB754|nr:hypothetical protein [Alkalihalobacillus pseudalcaliphilus]KMK78151.1 hypothetical protein AB990_01555 [Alkalihalobacillus pseudalcaliphilus]